MWCQLLTYCLHTPKALFDVRLCDAGTETLHTPFLFRQLALCYVLPIVVPEGECKVGGGREDLLLFKGFWSACGFHEYPPNTSSSRQKQCFPVAAAETSLQFSNTCKPDPSSFLTDITSQSVFSLES